MPLRKDIDPRANRARRPGGIYVDTPEPALRPVAHRAIDCLRAETPHSTDCAERVATVLQKLGYGVAMIPRGKSAPQGN